MSMNEMMLGTGSVLFLIMVPILYRVIKGPTAIDRLVAVNMIGTKAAILLVIIGSLFGRVEMFVDFALTYALLNFFGSIAASRYYHRKAQEGGDKFKEEVRA